LAICAFVLATQNDLAPRPRRMPPRMKLRAADHQWLTIALRREEIKGV
jgi:hypothetical protein